jgi:cyclophilin family peptidyl-prolyl cis-trans isomerase
MSRLLTSPFGSLLLVRLASLLLIGCLATAVIAQEPATEPAPAEAAAAPAEAPAPNPAGLAAKQAFDALQTQWSDLIGKINAAVEQRRGAPANQRAELDAQIVDLRRQADGLVDKIVDAALKVYQAAPTDYPEINQTLLAILQFYLVGDRQGDGGDQYEKAFVPLKAMLEAGAGEQWPYLWTWAGIAAYCSHEFDLAGQYFDQAKAAGALGDDPPSRDPADPRAKLWQTAQQFQESLPAIKQAWAKEQTLRAAEAQADDLPRVKLTTSQGDVVIELFENEAPQAVANFLTLVKQGFYDGVVFHRVLPGFMAQGGDPTGTGSGGPGYSIRCECYTPQLRRHFRGSLSMAHAGKDTGGSQFFLTFVPTSFLDGRHTVFGRVIEGMDKAASIRRRDPQSPNPPQPDRIIKAEVLRDRGHDYNFARLPER